MIQTGLIPCLRCFWGRIDHRLCFRLVSSFCLRSSDRVKSFSVLILGHSSSSLPQPSEPVSSSLLTLRQRVYWRFEVEEWNALCQCNQLDFLLFEVFEGLYSPKRESSVLILGLTQQDRHLLTEDIAKGPKTWRLLSERGRPGFAVLVKSICADKLCSSWLNFSLCFLRQAQPGWLVTPQTVFTFVSFSLIIIKNSPIS